MTITCGIEIGSGLVVSQLLHEPLDIHNINDGFFMEMVQEYTTSHLIYGKLWVIMQVSEQIGLPSWTTGIRPCTLKTCIDNINDPSRP